MNPMPFASKIGEVVCLCCNQRVSASLMNGEWRRGYHHNRQGRACSGSRMPVISETVILKDKIHVNEV